MRNITNEIERATAGTMTEERMSAELRAALTLLEKQPPGGVIYRRRDQDGKMQCYLESRTSKSDHSGRNKRKYVNPFFKVH